MRVNAPARITPRRAESGQAARLPGLAERPCHGDPACLFAGATSTAWTLAAATALLLAGPTAAMQAPGSDHPRHRDHPLVGEIRAIAGGAALTPAQLAA